MNLNRRHFLRACLASIFYVGQLNGKSFGQELFEESLLKRWLELLLPQDRLGKGGTHKQVLEHFDKLMQEKDFKEGIELGLQALDEFNPTLDSQNKLDVLIKNNMPEANFLRALYELLLESFYGQECGWKDLDIENPLINYNH